MKRGRGFPLGHNRSGEALNTLPSNEMSKFWNPPSPPQKCSPRVLNAKHAVFDIFFSKNPVQKYPFFASLTSQILAPANQAVLRMGYGIRRFLRQPPVWVERGDLIFSFLAKGKMETQRMPPPPGNHSRMNNGLRKELSAETFACFFVQVDGEFFLPRKA